MDNGRKFIEKAKKVHGEKYDYSKVQYGGSQEPVVIVCPEHGDFIQKPANHVRGNGCPVCGSLKKNVLRRMANEDFLEKAVSAHGSKYDYSKTKYTISRNKVTIICPEHGEFTMLPLAHLHGQGCPKCAGRNLTTRDILEKFKAVHGSKYDYSKTVYTKMHDKVTVICPEHGEFQITPSKHILGQGCVKCGMEERRIKQYKDTASFVEAAKNIHGDKYGYSKTNYVSVREPVTITCEKHGDFQQIPNDHLCGHGCPKCGVVISYGENELYGFISKTYKGIVIRNSRETIDGKQEIDILLPDKRIAFEYDGVYWHSEACGKSKDYHIKKTEDCAEKGIKLIHIFEDEWSEKKEICLSRIKNLLGVADKRVFARKCNVKTVDASAASKFLESNHIQGKTPSQIAYGLYFDDELVSIMTFGKLRKNLGSTAKEGSYELLRFCNKLGYSIPGAASRLLTHFKNDYHPMEIVSYADRRWSNGNVYEKLGFNLDHISKPNYFYVVNGKRRNRFSFRKDVLVRKYGCPPEMTEHEFCKSKGWWRIYDCGCLVYKWKNN